MMRFRLFIVAGVLLAGPVGAQQTLEPRQLIEAPTAGLLPRGSFDMDFRFYDGNGILGRVSVGLFDRVMVGVSFGGQELLGNRSVQWNPRPEFQARVRIVEERHKMPAFAVGYISQGYGAYDQELSRYARKSKGIYGAMSKNFGSLFGQGGLHAGLNRSLEDGDEDQDLSGFIGVDKQVGKDFILLLEYDFALNDNEDSSLGSGRGFMNAGARWTISGQFAVEFDVKNIFRNGQRNPNPDREFRIVYFEQF